MRRRLLALTIALCMAILLLPMTAWANENVASVTPTGGTPTQYQNFLDAVAAVNQSGGTLQLLAETVSADSAVTISNDVTLELNGKTLNSAGNITVSAGADLTIQDSSNERSGKIIAANDKRIDVQGNLNVLGGTVEGSTNFIIFITGNGNVTIGSQDSTENTRPVIKNSKASTAFIKTNLLYNASGTATVYSGTFEYTGTSTNAVMLNCLSNKKITVLGGNFKGGSGKIFFDNAASTNYSVSGGTFDKEIPTSVVDPQYTLTSSGNQWTVVPVTSENATVEVSENGAISYYGDLSAAMKAAGETATVTLKKNAKVTSLLYASRIGQLVISPEVTLESTAGIYVSEADTSGLKLVNNGTITTSTFITGNAGSGAMENNGTITCGYMNAGVPGWKNTGTINLRSTTSASTFCSFDNQGTIGVPSESTGAVVMQVTGASLSINKQEYAVGTYKWVNGVWTLQPSVAEVLRGETVIGSYQTVSSAIAAAQDGDTVRIKDNVSEFTVSSTTIQKNITIDLNGAEGENASLQATWTVGSNGGGSSPIVTIKNGTLNVESISQNSGVIQILSGQVTAEDLDIRVTKAPIAAGEPIAYGVLLESGTFVLDAESSITSNSNGLYVGTAATAKISGDITLTGDSSGMAIQGDGNNKTAEAASTITIYESSEISAGAGMAIYHPQAGTLNIEGGTITGSTAIGIRSGTLNITGGTIRGTGDYVENPSTSGGGISGNGSAIFVGSDSGYFGNIQINISGTSTNVKSDKSYAVYENVKEDSSESSIQALAVTGGNISSGIQTTGVSDITVSESAKESVSISGGTFSKAVPADYCAPGLVPTGDEGGSSFGVVANSSIFSSGNGTEATPFIISTPSQLKAFAESVNSGEAYAGKYIELDPQAETFDLSSISSWPMIGQGNDTTEAYKPFSGHFNGNNRPITGLKIGGAVENSYVGFFGYLTGATVENVVIQNAEVTCNQDNWVGVLAGRANNSTISGCTVSGTITVSGSTPVATKGIAAAGLVEYLYDSKIENSHAAVNIAVSSSASTVYVGGIACEVNGSTIEGCTNSGIVSGYSTYYNGAEDFGYSYVGGIAAYMKNGSTVENCTNTGTVSSGDAQDAVYATAGGILGQVWHEEESTTELVNHCRNEGNVTAAAKGSDSYAGGIVGEIYQYDPATWAADTRSDITISNCTNTGAVTAAGGVGGILAWGDMEWKLNLSGNTYAGTETGWFNAPAEFTLGDENSEYKYSEFGQYSYIFQTLHLEGDLNITGNLTVVSAQTLVIEDGVTVTGTITVEPGGQLVVEDGADVTGSISAGTGHMITFKDGNEVLFQMATEASGAVILPAAPTKPGYVFAGWFTSDGQQISSGTSVETDTIVTAKWSPISYGGGSSSSGDYLVSVENSKNGKITVSPGRADKGDTVTITAKPDDGYELDTLTVTDKNGDSVKVSYKGANQYTFTMPASKVTIEATFVEASERLPFTDVAVDDYFYDAVAWAVENGVTAGTSATTFSPNVSCTRAQTVTFLWRAAGSPTPKTTSNPFTDVKESDYYYEAVLWAVENNITTGTTPTTFSPASVCTRGQVVTFLYRYNGTAATAHTNFTDVSEDAYYYDAVQWAAQSGITTGTTPTTFNPASVCTRGQIVTFLFRDLAE